MAIKDFIKRRKVAISSNFNDLIMSNKYPVAGYLVWLIPFAMNIRPWDWGLLIACLLLMPPTAFALYLGLNLAGEFGKWLEKPWRKDYKSRT